VNILANPAQVSTDTEKVKDEASMARIEEKSTGNPDFPRPYCTSYPDVIPRSEDLKIEREPSVPVGFHPLSALGLRLITLEFVSEAGGRRTGSGNGGTWSSACPTSLGPEDSPTVLPCLLPKERKMCEKSPANPSRPREPGLRAIVRSVADRRGRILFRLLRKGDALPRTPGRCRIAILGM